jgi:hypothetical protein
MAAIVLMNERGNLLGFMVAGAGIDIPLRPGKTYPFTLNTSNPKPELVEAHAWELFSGRNGNLLDVRVAWADGYALTSDLSAGLTLTLAFPRTPQGAWEVVSGAGGIASGSCSTDLLMDFERRYADPAEMETWTDDPASLYAQTGLWAVDRHLISGFDAMNSTEKVIASLWLFDNERCNGGVGQWLDATPADLLQFTPAALDTIGCTALSRLANRILQEASGDEAHVVPADMESEFYDRLYNFVKANWRNVRQPGWDDIARRP